jgi:photosystem I subunit X
LIDLLVAQLPNPFPEDPTALWNWQGTPIMIGACLFSLFLASRVIRYPNVGPKMPLGPFSGLFNNISVASFLAAMSFGHILGVLAIMGLSGWLQDL